MLKNKQHGFTLIELMIVVVIAAILAGLAMPSLRATMDRNAINAESLRLARSISFARSHAVNRQQVVTLERKGGTSRDWSTGWTIYVDNGGQGNEAINLGDGDTLIQDVDIDAGTITIRADAVAADHISFNPAGRLLGAAGQIDIAVCDAAVSDRVDGSLLQINLVGRSATTAIDALPAATKAARCTPV